MGTDVFSNLPWLQIILAGVAYFILGAVWYRFIFKNAWIKVSGVNVNCPTMLASLVLMIVASLGIAIFLSRVGVSSWMSGAKVGLVAGVCFSATSICISYLYEKRPWALHFINAGYNVGGCVLAGIVLAIWGE